jgi:hypothetical protein
MALDYIGNAGGAADSKCSDSGAGTMAYDVYIQEANGPVRRERRSVPLPRCGEPVPESARYQRGAVPDLKIRR